MERAEAIAILNKHRHGADQDYFADLSWKWAIYRDEDYINGAMITKDLKAEFVTDETCYSEHHLTDFELTAIAEKYLRDDGTAEAQSSLLSFHQSVTNIICDMQGIPCDYWPTLGAKESPSTETTLAWMWQVVKEQKRLVVDQRLWIAQSTRQFDLIGRALESVRATDAEGKPVNGDAEEIALLVSRYRRLLDAANEVSESLGAWVEDGAHNEDCEFEDFGGEACDCGLKDVRALIAVAKECEGEGGKEPSLSQEKIKNPVI